MRNSSQGLQQISLHITFKSRATSFLDAFQNWLKDNVTEHRGHVFPRRTFNIAISLVSFNPLTQCFYHPVLKNRFPAMKKATDRRMSYKRIRR
jgi:hypothetical protein